ncbi:hypothetical protein BC940DRAFT_299643 [Gongronella butleri]|nr:hypothetical protein BC940DRAFT_299643 [Gongronella butleri]
MEAMLTAQASIQLLAENADLGERNVTIKELTASYGMAESYRHCTWSPTCLSPSYGCLLTAVTTKNRVLLFHCRPKTDRGRWLLHRNMTHQLQQFATDNLGEFTTADQLDRFRTLTASWSSRIPVDPLGYNPAILSLGNGAGEVSLWFYSIVSRTPRLITSQKLHRLGLNVIEWTKWTKAGENRYLAYLVSGSLDGTVTLSKIELVANEDDFDQCTVTSLRTWFQDQVTVPSLIRLWETETELRMVVAKQVLVFGLTIQLDNVEASVTQDWVCQFVPHTAVGVVGGYWCNNGQQFRVYTYEGIGVAYNVGVGRLERDDHASMLITKKLRRKFKQQWSEELSNYEDEELRNQLDSFPVVYGATGTPNGLYTPLVFSIRAVTDTHAAFESKDVVSVSAIIHPKINGEDARQVLMRQLSTITRDPYFFFTSPVGVILNEMMEFILDEESMDATKAWHETMQALCQQPDDISIFSPENVVQRVYCTPMAIAQRIVIGCARRMDKFTMNEDLKQQIHDLTVHARHFVMTRFLQTMLEHVNGMSDATWSSQSDDDLAQVRLWCHRVLCDTLSPLDVLQQTQIACQRLSSRTDMSSELAIVHAAIHGQDTLSMLPPPLLFCPACAQPMLITSTAHIYCGNGHVWPICLVTIRLIASPYYRECVNCNVKALSHEDFDVNSLAAKTLRLLPKCVNCASDLVPSHA